MGPQASHECCPDCRGTGSAVVKLYVDWAVAQERERCAKIAAENDDCRAAEASGQACDAGARIAAAIRLPVELAIASDHRAK